MAVNLEEVKVTSYGEVEELVCLQFWFVKRGKLQLGNGVPVLCGEQQNGNNYHGRLYHVNVIEDELQGDPYDLSQ